MGDDMDIIQKGIKVLLESGPLTLLYYYNERRKRKLGRENLYYKWIKENEREIMKTEQLKYNPLMSVIIPVYNVKTEQLIECIESVRKQTYSNWEICIADDASTWESVINILKSYEGYKGIKIVYRKENGHISRATNSALELATGEYVGFLDCDDTLAPNALYEMVKKLNENLDYDFIYSDEDKISDDGKNRHSPYFKPDWSPDTFMSLMYTCHFAIYRKSIVDEIGRLRAGYEGAQDYDLTLRFVEKTNKIGHINKILYHWRERPESTAINPQSKPYIFEATRKVKEEALKRRGLTGQVELVEEVNQFRVKYTNSLNPKVSIIIPSKDNYDVLATCINSIKKNTKYKNVEIIVIDNGSNEENRDLYEKLCINNVCRYHYENMDFNFSKMCNIGARLASGQYYLFLNDDIEIITPEWLDILVGHASLDYIGAVGAKLYYPNSKRIQHVGVTNLEIGPSHSLVGFDDSEQYYYCRNKVEHNYAAVTGACLMINKDKFDMINGFDEELPVAYNDVELCFKLLEKGLYNVVRNDVVLFHHESISRGIDHENEVKLARLKKELIKLYEMHPIYKGFDPFYNSNLSCNSIDYNINVLISNVINHIIDASGKNKNYVPSEKILAFVDTVSINEIIKIEGWAYNKSALFPNLHTKYVVIIDENDNIYKIKTDYRLRTDVTSAFGSKKNLNFSGYYCSFEKNVIRKGRYKIQIAFKSLFGLRYLMADTGKIVEIE